MRKIIVLIAFFVLLISKINAQNIIGGEYFFDTDPGIENGHHFSVKTGTEINENLAIATTGLSLGFHTLFIRVKNEKSIWSQYESRPIYLFDPKSITTNIPTTSNIIGGEWFTDVDPGLGNGTPFSTTSGSEITKALSIATNGMSIGFHTLFIRVKNEKGIWSHYESRPIYLFDPKSISSNITSNKKIISGEWFVDTDPGIGKASVFSLTADSNIIANISMQLPNLVDGDHNLFVRVKNEDNIWSHYESKVFTICSPPPAPSSKDTSICENTTATLKAKGTGKLSWYTEPKGGLFLGSGETLTIDTLKTSVTIYVQDSLCGVSVARTPVKINVNSIPKIIAKASNTTICFGDSIHLTSFGADTYNWNVNLTSNANFIPKESTNVKVIGKDIHGCSSSDSITIIVTKPTTSSTTETTCGSYTWNGKNYTQSGTYTYTAKNKIGCDSIASLVLTIKETPNVTTTISEKNITTTQKNAKYQWLNCSDKLPILNETKQQFTPNTSGSYAVSIDLNGCMDTSTCINFMIGTNNIHEITKEKISIYPNPSNGNIKIANAPIGNYTIINDIGEIIYQFHIDASNELQIHLDAITTGVYFLQNETYNIHEKLVVIE